MITDKEITAFWIRFVLREVIYFFVWSIGFISTAVIWAFILKHVFKVKWKIWLLNDTVDGDFGADWWLRREGLKPGLWSAFRWWWRNKAWNFYIRSVPKWNAGEVDEFRMIKLTILDEQMYQYAMYNRFTKANKEKEIYGINYYCYKLNGKVFCNYSKASPSIEMQFGAGGQEYRNWIKR